MAATEQDIWQLTAEEKELRAAERKRALEEEIRQLPEVEVRARLRSITALETTVADHLWEHSEVSVDFDNKPLTRLEISARIKLIADLIMQLYPNERPLFVGLLDGVLPFLNDLQNELEARNYPCDFTTMSVTSYKGTEAGELSINSAPKMDVGGRCVLVLDDVCDTGNTLNQVYTYLMSLGADKIDFVTLVDKVKEGRLLLANLISGLQISDKHFVVGYGMDYRGMLRGMKEIHLIDQRYLPTEEEKLLLDQKKPLNQRLQAIMASKKEALNELNTKVVATPEKEAIIPPGYGKHSGIIFCVKPSQHEPMGPFTKTPELHPTPTYSYFSN